MKPSDIYNFEESVESIHDRMIDEIDPKFNRTEGSFFYDATKPPAKIFYEQNLKLWELSLKQDIEFLTESELTRRVFERTNIVRKNATKATTTITFQGLAGSTIQIGDLVASDNMEYEVLENITLNEEGFGEAEVIAKEYGIKGNCPEKAITKMPRTLGGITSLYNESEVINGYEEESDEDLRERYYQKIRNPGLAGNKAHYREWSQSIEEVGEVEVTAVWEGEHLEHVLVTLLDRNGRPASDEIVDVVSEYITNEQLPVGAKLKVQAAIAENIDISVDLILLANWSIDEIKESIKESLTDYFQGFAFKEKIVSYAKVGSLILSMDGIKDYNNLLINGQDKNLDIKDLSVPVVGKLELTGV